MEPREVFPGHNDRVELMEVVIVCVYHGIACNNHLDIRLRRC